MLLRARQILTSPGRLVEDGALLVKQGAVTQAGKYSALVASAGTSETIDLGETLLIPGLVNSHCHLEYSAMAGQKEEERRFLPWVGKLVETKRSWDFETFLQSWEKGEAESLRSGTTTLIDNISIPALLRQVWAKGKSRIGFCLEMTGLLARRDPAELLKDSLAFLALLHSEEKRFWGLAPHAIFSTHPDLLKAASETAIKKQCLLSIHVAESEAEHQMFSEGAGPLFEWIKKLRMVSEVGGTTAVQLLRKWNVLGSHLLLIHGNHVEKEDAHALGLSETSVVHCPRSHAFFNHSPFPLALLLQEKVNICLGTDSLASIRKTGTCQPNLSMFEEMAEFRRLHPQTNPQQILQMATTNPAGVLKLPIGKLEAGSFADLLVLPYNGTQEDALEWVVSEKPRPSRVMVRGEWVE